MTGSPLIKEFPQGKEACDKITAMKKLWKVPVTGTGVPPKATVENCTVEASGVATIEMSAKATETGGRVITIGHPIVGVYEPITQIETKFPGQTLVVK